MCRTVSLPQTTTSIPPSTCFPSRSPLARSDASAALAGERKELAPGGSIGSGLDASHAVLGSPAAARCAPVLPLLSPSAAVAASPRRGPGGGTGGAAAASSFVSGLVAGFSAAQSKVGGMAGGLMWVDVGGTRLPVHRVSGKRTWGAGVARGHWRGATGMVIWVRREAACAAAWTGMMCARG